MVFFKIIILIVTQTQCYYEYLTYRSRSRKSNNISFTFSFKSQRHLQVLNPFHKYSSNEPIKPLSFKRFGLFSKYAITANKFIRLNVFVASLSRHLKPEDSFFHEL